MEFLIAVCVLITISIYSCLVVGAQADRDMERLYKELEEKE